jgi:ribosomal protein S18 acetylase RimI-like enzyme
VAEPSAPFVRPYRTDDLPQLYEICLRTGDAGEDARALVDDPTLFGAIYAAPYGVLEPARALVVDDGSGRAVGYVLGALDTRAFEAKCEERWWPALRSEHPKGSGGNDLDELLIGIVHEPHLADARVVAQHPSHLHVDLLPEVQGGGWGRRLMEELHELLRAAGSPGVHLGVSTRNERALGFYDHLGYDELRRNALSHTLGLRL